MKQNDPQEYIPTKTVLCMMVALFVVGIFIVGEGVNIALRQRVKQTAAQQAQTNSQWDRRPIGAGGEMKYQWRDWHFRRHHHHHHRDRAPQNQ